MDAPCNSEKNLPSVFPHGNLINTKYNNSTNHHCKIVPKKTHHRKITPTIFTLVRLVCQAGSAPQYHYCYSTVAYSKILDFWNFTVTICYNNQPLPYHRRYNISLSHKSATTSHSSPGKRVLNGLCDCQPNSTVGCWCVAPTAGRLHQLMDLQPNSTAGCLCVSPCGKKKTVRFTLR